MSFIIDLTVRRDTKYEAINGVLIKVAFWAFIKAMITLVKFRIPKSRKIEFNLEEES